MKVAVLSELPLDPFYKSISERASAEGGIKEGDAHLTLLGAHLLSDSNSMLFQPYFYPLFYLIFRLSPRLCRIEWIYFTSSNVV